MRHISVTVNLVVKAETTEEALSHVASRLNAWFCEDLTTPAPFANGSLMLWNATTEDGKEVEETIPRGLLP